MVQNQGLETLEIWNKAVDFAVDLCQEVLPMIPQEEKWALSSQMETVRKSV